MNGVTKEQLIAYQNIYGDGEAGGEAGGESSGDGNSVVSETNNDVTEVEVDEDEDEDEELQLAKRIVIQPIANGRRETKVSNSLSRLLAAKNLLKKKGNGNGIGIGIDKIKFTENQNQIENQIEIESKNRENERLI